MNLFTRWTSRENALPPPPQPVEADEHQEAVSAREQITALLYETMENRHILTVIIRGIEQHFNSVLFNIDAERGFFYLDELIPREGQAILEPNRYITLKACLKGVMISFQARIHSIAEDDGIPYYRLYFPEAINFKHRREHHRVALPVEHQVPVYLVTPIHRLVTGELRNISLGGTCLRLSRNAARGIRPGDVIQCTIDIPELRKITTSLEIRNISELHTQNSRRLGGRFIDLARRDQNDLLEFIYSLDRRVVRE